MHPLLSVQYRTASETFGDSNGAHAQPLAKRRKLGGDSFQGSQPTNQPSFADVLERLKEDAGEAKGMGHGASILSISTAHADVEGGADCWPRPKLSHIDEKRDAISKYTVHAPNP